MNQHEKIEVKKRLHGEIEKAKEQIQSLEHLVKPISPDNAIGRLSRMEAIGTKAINESSLGKTRHKLSCLKTALSNLNEPEFGMCFECGKDIPIGRILLLPEAKMCVACAEAAS